MKYYTILFAMLLLAGCKKETTDDSGEPYFIFGKAYGECGGNCATFFNIQGDKLYADDMQYYTGTFAFQSSALPNSKYETANVLRDSFPSYLASNPNKTFGCPDCHDQGGIYIKRCVNGQNQYWNIDTDTAEQPIEIRAYVQQVFAVIDSLD